MSRWGIPTVQTTLQCTAYLLYPYLGFLHHGRRKAYRSDFHLKCLFCANKAHGLPCRGAQRTQTWDRSRVCCMARHASTHDHTLRRQCRLGICKHHHIPALHAKRQSPFVDSVSPRFHLEIRLCGCSSLLELLPMPARDDVPTKRCQKCCARLPRACKQAANTPTRLTRCRVVCNHRVCCCM